MQASNKANSETTSRRFMVDSILTVLRLVSTTMLAAVAGAHQRVHRARPALREMALRQGVRWGATARLLHLLVVSPPGSLVSSSARELAGEKGSKEQEQEQVERGDRRGRRGTGDASVSSRELQQLQSLAFQGAHSPSLQKFLARELVFPLPSSPFLFFSCCLLEGMGEISFLVCQLS